MGLGPVPRQEFCHAIDGMICDAGKNGAEVGLGIDAVELGGLCRPANYAERVRYDAS